MGTGGKGGLQEIMAETGVLGCASGVSSVMTPGLLLPYVSTVPQEGSENDFPSHLQGVNPARLHAPPLLSAAPPAG